MEELPEEPKQACRKLFISYPKVVIMGIFLACLLPVLQIGPYLQYQEFYQNFMKQVALGPLDENQQEEIPFSSIYWILARNPFQGQWEASIKRSEFLNSEKGMIEIKVIKKTNNMKQINSKQQKQKNKNHDSKSKSIGQQQTKPISHHFLIRIYDGYYRDDGFYEIFLDIDSNKVGERFQPGQLLFVTTDPLIAAYRYGKNLNLHSQKTLYIDQIKIKVKASSDDSILYPSPTTQQISLNWQSIRIQFLLSSEYSLNIVSKSIKQYPQIFHTFPILLCTCIQIFLQIYGISHIYFNVMKEKSCSSRYSIVGFVTATGLDVIQGVFLLILSLSSQRKFAILLPVVFTLWVSIILLQVKVLILINRKRYSQRQETNKFTLKIYTIFIVMLTLTYWLNISRIFFIGASLLIVIPQIIRNYLVGHHHHLKKSMGYFLYYALPRYWLIGYTRLYSFNIFNLERDLTLLGICLILIVIQVTIIFIQIKYGARSILPRILHPQEFKYFMSHPEPEDNTCSICLISLNQRSPQNHATMEEEEATFAHGQQLKIIQQKDDEGERQEINTLSQEQQQQEQEQYQQEHQQARKQKELFNNVVLTPCLHKFHIECLVRWMESKLQCPNCRTILPPIQDYK